MKLFILRMKVPCAIFVIKMPYQNVLSLSKRGLALKVLSKLLYAIADNKGNYEELKILHQKILNDSLSLNELASDSGNDTFRIEEIPWERLLDAITNTNPIALLASAPQKWSWTVIICSVATLYLCDIILINITSKLYKDKDFRFLLRNNK